MGTAVDTCNRIAHGLSPLANPRGSIIEALYAMARIPVGSIPQVTLLVNEAVPIALNDATSEHLYRLAQQAFANALQRAGATAIEISVEASTSFVTLKIVDNGIGISDRAMIDGRLGLQNMRYRANSIHARLSIAALEPHGTIVTVECPHRN